MFNIIFSDCPWNGNDSPMKVKAKLMKLKHSYFIQCLDLVSAESAMNISEEDRDVWKQVIASYLKEFPAASFEDFTGAIATEMLANGEMKGKEKKNAKEYINKLRSKRGY